MKLYHILLAAFAFCTVQVRAMETPYLSINSSNQLDTMKISAIAHSDYLLEQEKALLRSYSQARKDMTKMEKDFKNQLLKKRKVSEVIEEFNKEIKDKNKEWQLPLKNMNISRLKFDFNDLNNAMIILNEKINKKEHINQKYEHLRDRSRIRWEAECLLKHYRDALKKSPTPATYAKCTQLFIESQVKWQYPMELITDINKLPNLIETLDTIIGVLEQQIAPCDQ